MFNGLNKKTKREEQIFTTQNLKINQVKVSESTHLCIKLLDYAFILICEFLSYLNLLVLSTYTQENYFIILIKNI